MDLIIRNARLRERDDVVDIGIKGSFIETIAPEIGASAGETIDADGGLVLPTFVESHTHLDIFRFEEIARPRKTGTHTESMERTHEVMGTVSFEEVKANARSAIKGYVANGTTKLRTHIKVSDNWGLTGLKAVLAASEELSHLADVQTIVYQTQPGLTPERYGLVEEAMELGADLVGGRPNTEDTDELAKQYTDEYFELAKRYDAGLDFHIDTTTNSFSRTLEYLAHKTIEEEYHGRVQAAHACALSHYGPEHRRKVIDLLKRADLNVNTCPEEDQFISSMDSTSVRELLEADVNLSIAHNDMLNPFYPFGNMDMLEAAWLLIHVFEFGTPASWNQMIDCLTYNPARALSLSDYGIEPGCKADLTVFREQSVRELLRLRTPRRYVVKDGCVVAQNEIHRTIDGG